MTSIVRFGFACLFIGLVSLVGCSDQGCEGDEYVCTLKEQKEAGLDYQEIIFGIMADSSEREMASINKRLAELGLDDSIKDVSESEKRTRELAKSIKANDCQAVFEILGKTKEELAAETSMLAADFLAKGFCLEQNPGRSAEIYRFMLDKGHDPNAAARLGKLYWLGEGVPADKEKADDYFTKAVLWQVPAFWRLDEGEVYLDATDTIDFEIWGLTYREMAAAFAETETGPWELPEPLKKKISWVKGMTRDNGAEAVQIGKDLISGTGIYQQDIETGLGWLAGASHYLNNEEARFLRPYLGMDSDLCRQRQELEPDFDCQWEYDYSRDAMENAAMEGNAKAIEFLVNYYSNSQDRWADWNLYQYVLIAKRYGVEVNADISQKARTNLGSFERELIETWVSEDIGLPMGTQLPY